MGLRELRLFLIIANTWHKGTPTISQKRQILRLGNIYRSELNQRGSKSLIAEKIKDCRNGFDDENAYKFA